MPARTIICMVLYVVIGLRHAQVPGSCINNKHGHQRPLCMFLIDLYCCLYDREACLSNFARRRQPHNAPSRTTQSVSFAQTPTPKQYLKRPKRPIRVLHASEKVKLSVRSPPNATGQAANDGWYGKYTCMPEFPRNSHINVNTKYLT